MSDIFFDFLESDGFGSEETGTTVIVFPDSRLRLRKVDAAFYALAMIAKDASVRVPRMPSFRPRVRKTGLEYAFA